MSTYGDQLRDWLDDSLQKLKDDYRLHPDRDWELRASEMWSRLGVAAGNGDPVVNELITLVNDLLGRIDREMTSAERADYLAGPELDRDVAEQIELAVTRHGPRSTDHPAEAAPVETAPAETVRVEVAPEEPAKQPAEVSEQVARDLALPVLRELARTRPDLVARHSTDELVARLGQVIARRLAGR